MPINFGFSPRSEGRYYYVSFSPADAPRVYKLCREMHRRGVNVWYDEAILSGDEWEKQAAGKIGGCREVILFVTRALAEKGNPYVRKELTMAREAGKTVRAVMLDAVDAGSARADIRELLADAAENGSVAVSSDDGPAEAFALMDQEIGLTAAQEAVPSGSGEKKPSKKEKRTGEGAKNESGSVKKSKGKGSEASGGEKKSGGKGLRLNRAVVICCACSALLIAGIVALAVFLSRTDDPEKYLYEVTDDGVVIMDLNDRNMTDLRIPGRIEGKPVIMIGEAAFSGCSEIKSVRIPDSVREIGSFAFLYCEKLEDVSIPGSVKVIGESAFSECVTLRSVRIPGSVTEIGENCFAGCTALEKISLPDSVTKIGESCFSGCSSLESAELPDGLTELGGGAFEGCVTLKKVSLPDGLKKIQYSTFDGCESLTEVEIPDSVTEIGDYAFAGCTALKSVTIPATVEDMVGTTFEDCPDLTIEGTSGSFAESYAEACGIPFRAV